MFPIWGPTPHPEACFHAGSGDFPRIENCCKTNFAGLFSHVLIFFTIIAGFERGPTRNQPRREKHSLRYILLHW